MRLFHGDQPLAINLEPTQGGFKLKLALTETHSKQIKELWFYPADSIVLYETYEIFINNQKLARYLLFKANSSCDTLSFTTNFIFDFYYFLIITTSNI